MKIINNVSCNKYFHQNR